MRTIIGLVAVVAVAVLAVLAWNWWANSNSQVQIIYPTEGAALSGNTVPVRLSASSEIASKLKAPGSQMQVVTYLNSKEVNRGKELEYNLTTVPPGQYKLEIAMSDQNGKEGVSLNLLPKPINFTLGGGVGASQDSGIVPPGTYSEPNAANANVPVPETTPTPVVINVPATPAPVVPTPAPALPATGLGGGQTRQLAGVNNAVQPASFVSSNLNSGQQYAVLSGSQSQLIISRTQVNPNAVAAAETSRQTAAPAENALTVLFRGMWAFYIAGFVVLLGLILTLKGRRANQR